MDTAQLTSDEKEQLRKAIEDAKAYKNKKLRELTLTFIGAIVIALFVDSFDNRTLNVLDFPYKKSDKKV
jgi:hypothetical protein